MELVSYNGEKEEHELVSLHIVIWQTDTKCFGGNFCPLFQGVQKMKTTGSFEKLVPIYQKSRHHIMQQTLS